MAAKKDDAPEVLRVVAPFAYATRTTGEVVMLVKGDVVGDGFKPESIEHLKSIELIALDK